ncbi:hypothetical protein DRN69_00255 [Candidatus Pacearchaeota archaeon]|nr:MAG: hypothetical protein DRN69_00255 [Candidatus Pacearchaeota archaeon]
MVKKPLGEKAFRMISEVLKDNDFCTAIEITKKTKLSKPTVLKYLRKMVKKGIIGYRKIGRYKLYYLKNPE